MWPLTPPSSDFHRSPEVCIVTGKIVLRGKKSLWCCWGTGNRSWRKSLPRDECSGYWLCMTPGWEGGKGRREPEHHCGTQQFSSSSRIHYTPRDFWDFSYSWARQEVLIRDNWPFVSCNSSEATSACSFASNGDAFYDPFLWFQTDPGFAWFFFQCNHAVSITFNLQDYQLSEEWRVVTPPSGPANLSTGSELGWITALDFKVALWRDTNWTISTNQTPTGQERPLPWTCKSAI